ncbi:hypothetical protein Gohar_006903 [Gossypium harknessii]|uniref:RNase H type-1 domain-containing protein n=1 Tax=Gossypium harknessii TaxID=34285 RepID=A0A7J9GGZ8_9ROSI|nr:hypothetical protein [Gossypium harknessii]
MKRTKQGIGNNSLCPVCGYETEYTLHVLRDCSAVNEVWLQVLPFDSQQHFFSRSLQEGWTSNLACHVQLPRCGLIWSCLFGLMVWRIWKNKNLFIFQDITWMTLETVKVSLNWAQQFELSHKGYQLSHQANGSQTFIGNTWAHLFTNEAVAFGDSSGFVGDGLLVLLNKGFKRITIQSDNMEVVRALQEKLNHAADCLAKMSLAGKTSLNALDGVKNEILEFI